MARINDDRASSKGHFASCSVDLHSRFESWGAGEFTKRGPRPDEGGVPCVDSWSKAEDGLAYVIRALAFDATTRPRRT